MPPLPLTLAVLAAMLAPRPSPPPDVLDSAALTAGGDNERLATVRYRVGPFAVRAIVFVTASGSQSYRGPEAFAGTRLVIRGWAADPPGSDTIMDSSFAARASDSRFSAAAARTFLLPAGESRTVQVELVPLGEGGWMRNRFTDLTADIVVIAAETPRVTQPGTGVRPPR